MAHRTGYNARGRAYHHGVVRPELFHYISQVENVAKTLDDRIAQNQEARKGFAG